MKRRIIKMATEDEFFQRGREIAKALDRGQSIPESQILSAEDIEDVGKGAVSEHTTSDDADNNATDSVK